MIKKEIIETFPQKDQDMINMFQLVFNENELDLITSVFGAEKLAMFMKLSSHLADSGRMAGLSFIAIILSVLVEQGTLRDFFRNANSIRLEEVSDKVH